MDWVKTGDNGLGTTGCFSLCLESSSLLGPCSFSKFQEAFDGYVIERGTVFRGCSVRGSERELVNVVLK